VATGTCKFFLSCAKLINVTILNLDNISKAYGKVKALKEVSFNIPAGSVFGILGPNGSGKTTLLSIILDILKADNGSYSWFGQSFSHDHRKQIGSLLETPNFYHYLNGVNNLKITHSISGRGNDAGIEDVLKKVNLYERRKSRFSTYSLGMKQRLAIAAALLGEPKVLVLDEPTNGLDPVGIAEIRELIKLLNKQGHTIIMASHLLDEVEKICTHVAILKLGNVLTHGAVDEVLVDEDIIEVSSLNMEGLYEVLKKYPADNLRREDHTFQLFFKKGTAQPADINQFCFDNGIILTQLALKKKRLETKFFELTNN
jgi:ABC-2 type transport system ATP-binding protein